MNLIRSMRGGKDYDAEFGSRMRGSGPYAWQIARRFEMASKKLGFRGRRRMLATTDFVPPLQSERQLALF
jgi:DNA repair photolyase